MIAMIGTALRFTTGERSTAAAIWRRTMVVQTAAQTCGYDARSRGISSSVERQLPKLERWVRFPYPALPAQPSRPLVLAPAAALGLEDREKDLRAVVGAHVLELEGDVAVVGYAGDLAP